MLKRIACILPVLFLLCFISGCIGSSPAETSKVFTVKRVIDGDTIELDNGVTVRYIGIDTPETKHPSKPGEYFGKEATEYNRKLVEGKKVKLVFDVQEKDKYGRLLAYVYLPDGTFVNAELVKGGYAQVATFPPNVKHQELFLKLQREAQRENRGLWSKESNLGNRVAELETQVRLLREKVAELEKEIASLKALLGQQGNIPQKENTSKTQLKAAPTDGKDVTVYITRTGKKYHRGSCRYLRKSMIPIKKKDAIGRGYTPCSVCKP